MDSTRYLLGRAMLVEERIRALVAHRRSHDPAPDDPFRGLYLSDDVVDALLAHTPAPPEVPQPARDTLEQHADAAERAGTELRLRRLARSAGLGSQEVEFLVICLLPDLDARFERLYGYLNDDVTRRRATVGLALELSGLSPMNAAARAMLAPGSALVDQALVIVDDADRPFLTRAMRVPDRVTAYLLGDDTPDAGLTDLLIEPDEHHCPQSRDMARAFAAEQKLCYLRESVNDAGVAIAAAALRSAGHTVICCDAARLARCADMESTVVVLGREALLTGASLVVSPVEALGAATADIVFRLARMPVPMVLTGTGAWNPDWSDEVPLIAEAARLSVGERAELWRRELGSLIDGIDVDDIAAQYVFGPRQITAAITAGQALARTRNGAATRADLRRGARSQNAAGLEHLARRIEPAVGWDDLVLPAKTLKQLQDLTIRARKREVVLSDWQMRPGGGRGTGVTALFAGDSGTGKTMAAEVIAGDLGLDLYTVNLATVVDKYIGETEKNLERIFTEASRVSAVLLFDEADAIFGKRSEVRDAHDRYANIESAYLLQRMETFDGLAVLATNLRANLDDAFTRRLDMVVDFPLPDEAARLALWRRCLAPPVPTKGDLELSGYAQSFPLSGGNIRSAAITAAYLAADTGTAVSAGHVGAAIQQEYRKLGRLLPTPESDERQEIRR
ncbi:MULTISPECIES: ATP-binding protein [unclassified Mycolicibacterium]|uniref:ATP-binding protein n=1 Tax=unclassified Mycolicibacterium TaxID=2636767 RepID=UPI002EDA3DEE